MLPPSCPPPGSFVPLGGPVVASDTPAHPEICRAGVPGPHSRAPVWQVSRQVNRRLAWNAGTPMTNCQLPISLILLPPQAFCGWFRQHLGCAVDLLEEVSLNFFKKIY